jgi:hypothetical protein
MSNNLQRALLHAAALTFEELGFMLPDSEINERSKKAALEAVVDVAFQGPFNGMLELRLYGNLLPTISANMLGEDYPPARKLQNDALGEIANVICGTMLPAIAGSKATFHLGAPTVRQRDELSALTPVENAAASAQVRIDDGRADVFLYMES